MENSGSKNKKFVLHDTQKIVAQDTHRYRVINAGRRWGKALDINTPILTTNGFKKLIDIVEGDFVFSEGGIPVKVTHKSEIYNNRKCYEVIFSDSTSIIADASHDWVVEDKKFRKNTARTKNSKSQMLKLTTEEMSKNVLLKRSDGRYETNYSIPTTDPVILMEKELPIDPYFLGQWLGDGTSSTSAITTEDEETVEYIYSYAKQLGMEVRVTNNGGKASSYSIHGKNSNSKSNPSLRGKLRTLGVLNNKHIPNDYKFSSIQQRLELLKGLMDSDGYIDIKGRCEYTTISKVLANDVLELLWSFGIKATIGEYDSKLFGVTVGRKFRIHFTTDLDIFSLKRKKERQSKDKKSDIHRRFIVDIKEVESRPVQCLTVNNPTHLFLAGKQLIATHNSTLIAWEMFAIAISNENARVPYYAPTRDDARDIMWKPLKDICGPLIIGEPNESRLEINVRNRFGGSSLIVLYGWEAVQERGKGVGVKNNHIFFDEVSKYKNFLFGWEEILSPTLLDLKGGATFISTPNGFNHFYDLSLMEGTNKDWKYFHFTTYDNPHIDPNEIQKKKEEITEDRFAQEYLGEFRKREGLVYKDFSRDKNVIDKLPDDVEIQYTLGGVDWGHTHPCAVITIKKDYNGNYYITDEFYKTGKTESEIVDKVVSLCYNKVYPDPENASGVEALKKAGVNIREVNKGRGSVISGISKVQELLKQGRIKVLSHCVNVIEEFESYSFEEEVDGIVDENPIKENDDAMDAIRYVLMTDIDKNESNIPNVHYGNNRLFINKIKWGKLGL